MSEIKTIPDEINMLYTEEEKICELEDIARKTITYKTHKGKDSKETLSSQLVGQWQIICNHSLTKKGKDRKKI